MPVATWAGRSRWTPPSAAPISIRPEPRKEGLPTGPDRWGGAVGRPLSGPRQPDRSADDRRLPRKAPPPESGIVVTCRRPRCRPCSRMSVNADQAHSSLGGPLGHHRTLRTPSRMGRTALPGRRRPRVGPSPLRGHRVRMRHPPRRNRTTTRGTTYHAAPARRSRPLLHTTPGTTPGPARGARTVGVRVHTRQLGRRPTASVSSRARSGDARSGNSSRSCAIRYRTVWGWTNKAAATSSRLP